MEVARDLSHTVDRYRIPFRTEEVEADRPSRRAIGRQERLQQRLLNCRRVRHRELHRQGLRVLHLAGHHRDRQELHPMRHLVVRPCAPS